jgi:hypothetical protein
MGKKTLRAHSDYLEVAFKDWANAVDRALEKIANAPYHSAIAVTGISGMMMGPAVAHYAGKNLLVVRKAGENSHSYLSVEGMVPEGEDPEFWYVILDDFVNTGETVRTIEEKVGDHFPRALLRGVVEYNTGGRREGRTVGTARGSVPVL